MATVDREAELAVAWSFARRTWFVDPGIVAAHVELETRTVSAAAAVASSPCWHTDDQHLRHAELRRPAGSRGGAALDDGFRPPMGAT